MALLIFMYSNFNWESDYYKILITMSLLMFCYNNDSLCMKNGRIICLGASFVVILECCIAVYQLGHQIFSHHKINLLGTFDNPIGFAISLVVLLPFVIYLYEDFGCRYKQYSLIIIILIWVLLIISQSRTGIIACACVCGFHVLKTNRYRLFFSRWRKTVIFFIGMFLIVLLYVWKIDSFNGRLLIWKSTVNMIMDNPLKGYGIGGFSIYYMEYQAVFLQTLDDIYWKQLADDVFHPFNEYLKLIVEFGIGVFAFVIIVFIFLFKCMLSKLDRYAILSLEVIIALIIIAFFSYPFHYSMTWILLGFALGTLRYSNVWQIELSLKIRALIFGFVFMICLFLCSLLGANRQWNNIIIDDSKSVISEYPNLYPSLKKDYRFLYNYAVKLNYNEKYSESITLLNEAILKRNNYDIQILLAENYEKKKMFDMEEFHLKKASLMCPNRFLPLYRLALYMINLDVEMKRINWLNIF